MNRFDRRRLLASLAASGLYAVADPFDLIVAALLRRNHGAVAQAAAATKRYISIQQPGAPARWMYDLLLNPAGSARFMRNAAMATRYAPGQRYTSLAYDLVDVDGFKVPPLWLVDLPAPGGTTRKLKSLLSNLLHIRGIDTNNAGHPASRLFQFMPLGAKVSLHGMVADQNARPFGAVNVNAEGYFFASTNKRSSVTIGKSSNYLSELLEPFTSVTGQLSPQFAALVRRHRGDLADLQRVIDSDVAAQRTVMEEVLNAKADARTLAAATFPALGPEWTRLKDKYENLVQRAVHMTYPGVNDKPIGSTDTAGRELPYRFTAGLVLRMADLRTIVQSDTTVSGLAEAFAAAEFIVSQDLSNSIALGHGGLINLKNGTQDLTQDFDEHSTGSMVSLFLNTLVFGAFGACLAEFIEALKGMNQFDQTVINVASEFNRSPRSVQSGSDHGFRGASSCLYSGAINAGPFVVGDILRDASGGDSTNDYPGTWGYGAPLAASGGVLTQGDMMVTLAAMLEAPKPLTTGFRLVTVGTDGRVTPSVPNGRIV